MNILTSATVMTLIQEIKADSRKQLIDELRLLLFTNLCAKGYLEECEPEYCSVRYTGNCKYIQAIHHIQKEYGIKLY